MAKVLIVDDDLVSRLVLSHMMAGLGFDVIEADSVDSAVESLHDEIELIVCDYQMPDRDGLDLLEVVGANVPFVLLTGVLDRDELADERVAKVTAYLTKPVSSDQLASVVSAIVPSTSTA